MLPALPKLRLILRRTAVFLLWTCLFAGAYAQSPLYTSNQNQYFLHGLARAGFGQLSQDWLANTLDPTPVFSWLVGMTYRLAHLEALYYVYYALLMGVYFFCLLGIAFRLFDLGASRSRKLALAGLVLLVHSAAFRFALSRSLGVNWEYILEDGIADQRMLGPVFQPSVFGVLLLVSVWQYLQRRPFLAVCAAALSAVFHPTYLLGAGILTGAYLLDMWLDEPYTLKPLVVGATALAVVSPVLIYVLRSFGGGSSEMAEEARQILVAFRIPHHTLVGTWLDATVFVKIALILAALVVIRRSALFRPLLFAFVAILSLSLLQIGLNSSVLALLFPWRLSILLVPLATTSLLAEGLRRLPDNRWTGPALDTISVVLILACFAIGLLRFKLDLDRKAANPEQAIYHYVYARNSSGDTYLTPVKMQDFRLETGAPAYVDFKSIPYQDSDVLEWYRREQLADNFYKNKDCGLLNGLAQEGVTRVVIELQETPIACPQLMPVYQDSEYGLYALQPPDQ
jgi:Domain of unknown function (DUF6798)